MLHIVSLAMNTFRILIGLIPGETSERRVTGPHCSLHWCSWSQGHSWHSLTPSSSKYSRLMPCLAVSSAGLDWLLDGMIQTLIPESYKHRLTIKYTMVYSSGCLFSTEMLLPPGVKNVCCWCLKTEFLSGNCSLPKVACLTQIMPLFRWQPLIQCLIPERVDLSALVSLVHKGQETDWE